MTVPPPPRAARSVAPAAAAALLALVALLGAAGSVGAQQVNGVALGPDGSPLPEVTVALHRVGGMGGSSVASATTDAEGRFEFRIEARDSALYFAAMRYEDRMYIGPGITGGGADVEGYELRAEPAAEAGAVAGALSGTGGAGSMGGFQPGGMGAVPGGMGAAGSSAGSSDAGAYWLVAILALAAAAIFLTTAPGYRRRRTRDTLVQLATVENRLADEATGPEREELEARRARLRGRLAPRT